MRFTIHSLVAVSLALSVLPACSEKSEPATSAGDKIQAPEKEVDLGASVLDLFPDTGVEPVEGSADAESSLLLQLCAIRLYLERGAQ